MMLLSNELSEMGGQIMVRSVLAMIAAVVVTVVPGAADIRGNYLEARNAEVYASHCFANSEMGIRGDLAVMAWQIEQGSVNGVTLDGLSVVAVVRASSTLGDPFGDPNPVKSVLIFDERATGPQKEALAIMAKSNARGLLNDVVHTEDLEVYFNFGVGVHDRRATLTVEDMISVETRPIFDSDSLCHLDDLYYTPLAVLDHAMPAFTLQNSYKGEGLDVQFSAPRRSSAYLGTFSIGIVQTD